MSIKVFKTVLLTHSTGVSLSLHIHLLTHRWGEEVDWRRAEWVDACHQLGVASTSCVSRMTYGRKDRVERTFYSLSQLRISLVIKSHSFVWTTWPSWTSFFSPGGFHFLPDSSHHPAICVVLSSVWIEANWIVAPESYDVRPYDMSEETIAFGMQFPFHVEIVQSREVHAGIKLAAACVSVLKVSNSCFIGCCWLIASCSLGRWIHCCRRVQ